MARKKRTKAQIAATNRLRYTTTAARARSNEVTKRWALANPERYAEIRNLAAIKHRLKKHGLTLEDFEVMLRAQDFCCAICRSNTVGNKRAGKGAKPHLADQWPSVAQEGDFTWHVDHDHQTGRVRGLLCHHCNAGLGHFKDRPDLLDAAARYLEK
jgi:hypothetical protein